MTIKKHGGIFGRNPAFNEVAANKLNVDNLQLDGNTIISTDANGNIGLVPNGTGSLLIGSNDQASYVAAKIRKKFNGSVSVQFDGGGSAIYADLSMDASENLSLRLDPGSEINDQTFSITHDGSAIAQFIGSSGDVKVNQGNLVIGTSGKGIDFSATAGTGTSELLNDYEEGTWTPTTAGDATGVIGANNIGFYVKTGRLVHVQCQFVVTTNFTSNAVGGLPYQPYIQSPISSAYGLEPVFTVGGTVYAFVTDTTTNIVFASNTNGTAHNPSTTGDTYRVQFTYVAQE